MPLNASFHHAEWTEILLQQRLSFLSVYYGSTLYRQTYTHLSCSLLHTHCYTHLWVLIHLLAVCPGDLPWRCRTVTLPLFLFPFLCCILFVPLLMEVAQKDVCFLCYNNLLGGVFTCWKVHWGPSIRCFTNRVCMKPAEVALVVDRKSFQEISLLHSGGNLWYFLRR